MVRPTHCSSNALQALFAGKPIVPCKATQPPPLERLTPLAPRNLAKIPPAPGSRGLPGRTLAAVVLTLDDFDRQLELQLAQEGEAGAASPSLRSGGLRAGWAGLTSAALTFAGYSYVPGVTISGRLGSSSSVLRVGGRAAARGTLRVGPQKTLSGVLGGTRVDFADTGPQAIGAQMARLARDAR